DVERHREHRDVRVVSGERDQLERGGATREDLAVFEGEERSGDLVPHTNTCVTVGGSAELSQHFPQQERIVRREQVMRDAVASVVENRRAAHTGDLCLIVDDRLYVHRGAPWNGAEDVCRRALLAPARSWP